MKRFSIAAVAVAALAVGLLLGLRSDGAAAQGPPDLDRVIEIQERHTDALLARPGVLGTGVGLNPRGHPAISRPRNRAADR